MKREDYIFTIGFDGNRAVVDKRTRNKFGRMDTLELAELGMYRAAYRSAVYEKDDESAKKVLEKFNTVSHVKYDKPSDLLKVFGIQSSIDDITGILLI